MWQCLGILLKTARSRKAQQLHNLLLLSSTIVASISIPQGNLDLPRRPTNKLARPTGRRHSHLYPASLQSTLDFCSEFQILILLQEHLAELPSQSTIGSCLECRSRPLPWPKKGSFPPRPSRQQPQATRLVLYLHQSKRRATQKEEDDSRRLQKKECRWSPREGPRTRIKYTSIWRHVHALIQQVVATIRSS